MTLKQFFFQSQGNDVPPFVSHACGGQDYSKIHTAFLHHLQEVNFPLYNQLIAAYLSAEAEVSSVAMSSQLILDGALELETFILSQLINYTPQEVPQVNRARQRSIVKQHFVQKRVIKGRDVCHLPPKPDLFLTEADYVDQVFSWIGLPHLYGDQLNEAQAFTRWALQTPEGKAHTHGWHVLNVPQKVDYQALVTPGPQRVRHGFDLTDEGPELAYALDHAHYCLYCHHRGKDTCATGKAPGVTNQLGVPLTGCPLKQKISEMNTLAAQGHWIAALAVAMIDNPLLPLTGHRICNECVQACIFEHQTPVDIPAIETHVWQQILELPWGFEIYHMLTRWHPLMVEGPLPRPLTHKNILVVGAGPAGMALSYYMLREGHSVVLIDGAKIEPLAPMPPCFKNMPEWFEDLSDRPAQGFGGVAEYGITSRWNKNYLLPVRVMLHRWGQQFQLKGSIRFGSTLTLDQALAMGFHHVALCTGAGKPVVPMVPNALAIGGKMAADFLMSLQQTGAQRPNALVPLTLQLPCYVIGGGLSAVDAATEAFAYYPLQVAKILRCCATLAESWGEAGLMAWIATTFTDAQQTQLATWRAHGALLAGADPQQVLQYLQSWGGVTILYHKAFTASPAYRTNPHELKNAVEEGVAFIDAVKVSDVITDAQGSIESLRVQRGDTPMILGAKSVIWALGTTSSRSIL